MIPEEGANRQGLLITGYHYGWPWVYRSESRKGGGFQFDGFDEIDWPGLIGDVIVGAAIIVATVLVVEWVLCLFARRNRRDTAN
jgi:hypothetical protein